LRLVHGLAPADRRTGAPAEHPTPAAPMTEFWAARIVPLDRKALTGRGRQKAVDTAENGSITRARV